MKAIRTIGTVNGEEDAPGLILPIPAMVRTFGATFGVFA